MLKPRLSAVELVRHCSRTPAAVAVALAEVSRSSFFETSTWPVFDPADVGADLVRDAKAKAQLDKTTARETDKAVSRRARLKRREQRFISR